MRPITRRTFLAGAGAAAIGATGIGGYRWFSDPASPPLAASNSKAPSAQGRLVLVFLDGGNDALNTVVPLASSAYVAARGGLAVDPDTTLDIGEGFGLHPTLSGCKQLWDQRRLAVVHGVGFAGLDRSHFHCRDVWSAGGEHDTTTGWIGRWLDLVGSSPLDAVAVGNRLPLTGRGARHSAAVVPTGPFVLPGGAALRSGLEAMSEGDDWDGPHLLADVARSTADLLEVVDQVPDAPAGEAGELDGGGELGAKLSAVNRLIAAGSPTKVFMVDLGGFDTHANQASMHGQLLSDLDTSIAEFLSAAPDDVTVAVYSEFGRRVRANGSGGTDHGGGGTMLVAGRVIAGHHGEPPPLDALDDGDLRTTQDFRSVYAGLIEGVLGTEASDVLDRAPRPLAIT